MSIIKANGHKIELSNPDKIIFPGEKISKHDLVRYYQKISDHILPYLKDRPMMLHRYPDGIQGKDFYQKDEPDYFPDWIDTIHVTVKKKGQEKQQFVNCNSEATLLYVTNQASLTPHVWLSKKNSLRHPDKMIYDLDPPEGEFEVVRQCARDFQELLEELELATFVMTTGSKGLHIAIPLDGKADFDYSREFARDVANLLAKRHPKDYTTETRKEKRKGRLFLDYLRNSHGQTSVAPYALRAKKGAPVATPIDWDELADTKLNARRWHYGNIFRRLGKKEDPWKDFENKKNNLKKARKVLDKMLK